MKKKRTTKTLKDEVTQRRKELLGWKWTRRSVM